MWFGSVLTFESESETTVSENNEAPADEVIIGSFEETHYLLKGLVYLDQILLGEEIVECPVNFITLESWPDVIAHWEEPDGSIPWSIHPQIVERLKVQVADRDLAVRREEQKNAMAGLEDDDEGWLDNLKG